MPVGHLKPPARHGELGVDRNVRQATDSDGEVYAQPDTSHLDANIKRKQRKAAKARERSRQSGQPLSNRARRVCGQLRKLHRKQRRRRENAAHRHSRKMADTAHAVVVEDLNVQAMTQSAKGTAEKPGTNVKAKSGLNREIPGVRLGPAGTQPGVQGRPGGGRWIRPTRRKPVRYVDMPARRNRKTQATFKCTACGHTANADRNAAVNILDRGRPLIRQARGGRGFCTARGVPVRDPDDP